MIESCDLRPLADRDLAELRRQHAGNEVCRVLYRSTVDAIVQVLTAAQEAPPLMDRLLELGLRDGAAGAAAALDWLGVLDRLAAAQNELLAEELARRGVAVDGAPTEAS